MTSLLRDKNKARDSGSQVSLEGQKGGLCERIDGEGSRGIPQRNKDNTVKKRCPYARKVQQQPRDVRKLGKKMGQLRRNRPLLTTPRNNTLNSSPGVLLNIEVPKELKNRKLKPARGKKTTLA